MKNPNKAPLYEFLKYYISKNNISFHMPGHKAGKAIPAKFRCDPLKIDLTELDETDNLHNPTGIIQKAQDVAACAFGAKETFFLVNGSTCGIEAMISSVCGPSDILIVDRNCHSSVISSLILTGAVPKYIYPEYIPELGIMGGIKPSEVESALKKYPEAKGVIITYPSYYGICGDIKAIANIVHKYGKVLLVDEAHGAHFCFHPELPMTSLYGGADICVQSAHKTLPALTQSSFLHVGSDRIDLHKLRNCLRLFQSTSPSYILMAYLDVSRCIMQQDGKNILDNTISNTQKFRETINSLGKVWCIGKEIAGDYGVYDFDLTRIVINFSNVGIIGYDIAHELSTIYGICVEMSDINNIVCIATSGNENQDFDFLANAIYQIIKNKKESLHSPKNFLVSNSLYAMSPREAFYSENENVKIEKSAGRICADTITCFPPGIPILCPGEIITDKIIKYLRKVHSYGGRIIGISYGNNIKVVKN